MSSKYQIEAVDGEHIIPHKSNSMDRTISVSFHTTPSAGTIEIKARPFGRGEFLAIDGSPAFPATAEKTITCSYPVAELKVILAGVTGGTVMDITVADAE